MGFRKSLRYKVLSILSFQEHKLQNIRPILLVIAIVGSCGLLNPVNAAELLREVPAGAQALSLQGEALYAAELNDSARVNLEIAQTNYESDPNDADNIIWLGRRIAYAGDYRLSIETFSEGVKKFPKDPRFYRHRGHRYISIREFNRAISDFETAAELMQNLPLQVEPDGLPNAQNIPLTSTQGNVWYHLGLAYYLKQDWPRALTAFRNGYNLGGYDDNLVSTGHWIYMILRRMGNEEEAHGSSYFR